jgi:hypothetical protein
MPNVALDCAMVMDFAWEYSNIAALRSDDDECSSGKGVTMKAIELVRAWYQKIHAELPKDAHRLGSTSESRELLKL